MRKSPWLSVNRAPTALWQTPALATLTPSALLVTASSRATAPSVVTLMEGPPKSVLFFGQKAFRCNQKLPLRAGVFDLLLCDWRV